MEARARPSLAPSLVHCRWQLAAAATADSCLPRYTEGVSYDVIDAQHTDMPAERPPPLATYKLALRPPGQRLTTRPRSPLRPPAPEVLAGTPRPPYIHPPNRASHILSAHTPEIRPFTLFSPPLMRSSWTSTPSPQLQTPNLFKNVVCVRATEILVEQRSSSMVIPVL